MIFDYYISEHDMFYTGHWCIANISIVNDRNALNRKFLLQILRENNPTFV